MAQIKNLTSFLYRINGRTKVAQGAQVSYFHYQTDAQGVEIPGSAFESAPEPVAVLGQDGVLLAGIVGLINTDTLAAVAELAAANATIADQAATIKELQDQINPHPSISIKAARQAVDQLKFADALAKALGNISPEFAKTWYSVDQINFTEPYWIAIDTEMTKSEAWQDHGGALIALAKIIAG